MSRAWHAFTSVLPEQAQIQGEYPVHVIGVHDADGLFFVAARPVFNLALDFFERCIYDNDVDTAS